MQLFITAVWLICRYPLQHRSDRVTKGILLFTVQGCGDIPNIVSLITVAGEGDLLSTEIEIAQPDAGCQDIHLTTRIIDIVFTVYLIACGLQQAGGSCSVCSPTTMAHMQGAGGVGRDILHQHLLTRSHLAFAIA